MKYDTVAEYGDKGKLNTYIKNQCRHHILMDTVSWRTQKYDGNSNLHDPQYFVRLSCFTISKKF